MSYRSTKAYSEKLASDFTNSNEVTLKKDDIFNPYRSFRNQDSYRLTESKSSTNFYEEKKSLDECELIN